MHFLFLWPGMALGSAFLTSSQKRWGMLLIPEPIWVTWHWEIGSNSNYPTLANTWTCSTMSSLILQHSPWKDRQERKEVHIPEPHRHRFSSRAGATWPLGCEGKILLGIPYLQMLPSQVRFTPKERMSQLWMASFGLQWVTQFPSHGHWPSWNRATVSVGYHQPSFLAPELCCLATRGQEEGRDGSRKEGREEIMVTGETRSKGSSHRHTRGWNINQSPREHGSGCEPRRPEARTKRPECKSIYFFPSYYF